MIYGIPGKSEMYIIDAGLEYLLPPGAIQIEEERPSDDAVLTEEGLWEIPTVSE